MNSKTLVLILFSLLFVSACTQTKEGALLTFEELDTDANGYISKAEAKDSADIARKFRKIDSNDDGQINIAEFQDYMGKGRMTPPEEMETSEPGAAPY